MDRFEVPTIFQVNSNHINLHSSMDRFEGDFDIIDDVVAEIYIPVWIDLKSYPLNFYRKELEDLHSSMDRFEV